MNNDTIIGMDQGNAKHAVCALGTDAKVLFRREVANEAEAHHEDGLRTHEDAHRERGELRH